MKQYLVQFIGIFIPILTVFVSGQDIRASKLQVPLVYSPPLGYTLSNVYGPYPFTKFGLQNPDVLNKDSCFKDETGIPIKWPQLFHAGTDWFELGMGNDTAVGDSVTAIADGVVEWTSIGARYPGEAVVIKHSDPDLGVIYSVYMHLDYSIRVGIGDNVTRGTKIGEVITQTITLIDGTVIDNSHLHWEVRTFADATQQSWFPSACDGSVAGEGYTKGYPTQYGYISPDDLLNAHIFLPYVRSDPSNTPTPVLQPTLTPTPTPSPTVTPTPIPCVAGIDLVQNGDFEDTAQHGLWISSNPEIALIFPYVTTPEPNYGLVLGRENSADHTIYQAIPIPPNVHTVDIRFLLYVETYEVLPFDYDYLYVDVVDGESVTGASLLHEPFAPFTNQFTPQESWQQQSLVVDDIQTLRQPVHLTFHATTNWVLPTQFIVDNVQLITGCQ